MRRIGVATVRLGLLAGWSAAAYPAEAVPAPPAQASPHSRGTAVVEGTVTYAADPERPWRYARYYVDSRKGGALADAVVTLSARQLKQRPREKPAEHVIDQKEQRFLPEITLVRAGDKVIFRNSDTGLHNVYSFHVFHPFDITMGPGREASRSFDRAARIDSPVVLGCKLHGHMRAWIYVFDHDYHQLTGRNGRFRLENVPEGEYRLEMAHPAGELRWSGKVRVARGETSTINIPVSPDDKVSPAAK